MAKLTSLSDEVLLEMASCAILGPNDLASLALVNKKLSRVANESLYKKFGERTAIEFAAENDSIGTLEAALYFGLDIHYDEHRALCLASKRGQLEAMGWLLSHGAPVDNALISGTFASVLNSPLYFALDSQQEEAAFLLMKSGATLRFIVPSLHNRGDGSDGDDHNNIPTIADETALHMAARGGLQNVIAYLNTRNLIPVDERTSRNPSALNMLIKKNSSLCDTLATFKVLISYGANINDNPESDLLPLTAAIESGQYDLANALLDAGARVNPERKIHRIWHPIHACAARSSRYIDSGPLQFADPQLYLLLSKLLGRGADLHESYPDGHTPLGIAVLYGTCNMVSYLISIGAGVNEIDATGRTPLGLLMRGTRLRTWLRLEKAIALLHGGARMDTRVDGEWTLLEWVFEKDYDFENLERLLALATPAMLNQEYLDELLETYFKVGYSEKCLVLMNHGATLKDHNRTCRFIADRIIDYDICVHPRRERSKYYRVIARAGFSKENIADLIGCALSEEDEETAEALTLIQQSQA